MARRLQMFLAAAVAALALAASAGEKAVRATGVAANYRAAVNEALAGALEQEFGVTVSASERQTMTHADSATSTRANGALDDRAKLEMNDAITKDMQKWAKGKISGYTVLNDRIENGKYRVEVEVRFPGAYAVGLDPANRRRMAVATFRSARAAYSWHGQAGAAADWARMLADKLNVCLTQTRKFTMLDRAHDAEIDAELARLSGANAAAADAARLGQKLGTDYLVVGEIAFNDVAAPAVNPYTGRALPQAGGPFAEITYRVLLAPTGQLKWADSVKIDAGSFAAADLAAFVSATTEAAACAISDGMMSNILPFEVVGRTASGQLVVGEGGKSLKAGEFLTVFALGEEVKDTRTGEVLDAVEEVVGTVQIVRVLAKTSLAQVVEGDAAKMVVGSRLRRVPLVVPSDVPAPTMTTPVKKTASGGVVVPF